MAASVFHWSITNGVVGMSGMGGKRTLAGPQNHVAIAVTMAITITTITAMSKVDKVSIC